MTVINGTDYITRKVVEDIGGQKARKRTRCVCSLAVHSYLMGTGILASCGYAAASSNSESGIWELIGSVNCGTTCSFAPINFDGMKYPIIQGVFKFNRVPSAISANSYTSLNLGYGNMASTGFKANSIIISDQMISSKIKAGAMISCFPLSISNISYSSTSQASSDRQHGMVSYTFFIDLSKTPIASISGYKNGNGGIIASASGDVTFMLYGIKNACAD